MNIKYTVYYKLPNERKFQEIKDVIADGVMPENSSIRFFITDDGVRYELSSEDHIIKLSKERNNAIKEIAKNNQDVPKKIDEDL